MPLQVSVFSVEPAALIATLHFSSRSDGRLRHDWNLEQRTATPLNTSKPPGEMAFTWQYGIDGR